MYKRYFFLFSRAMAILVSLLCFINNAQALIYQPNTNGAGIGAVAGNLLQPISGFRYAMNSASIILGFYLLISAFTRYLKFRENPQESPLSTVFMWLILGIALILIPVLHYLAVLAAQQTGVSSIVT